MGAWWDRRGQEGGVGGCRDLQKEQLEGGSENTKLQNGERKEQLGSEGGKRN